MRIIKCYVENFGLLHAQEYSFNKSINCCISDNGTGKTTLAAFIEAMLYGIGDSRRALIDENPRKKYNPWQGGKFGGTLTFESGKKKYTVERSFGARPADDTFRLIDSSSGRECADFDENLGEALFGIDREGFLRTVYLSEKNLQGKNDNKSISAKLSDLVGVDGDVGGFDNAIKLLDDRRKFYYKKGNTGEIANVKEKIADAKRRLDDITRLCEQTAKKEDELAELREQIKHLSSLESAEQEKLATISKQHERQSHEERYTTMLSALATEKRKHAALTDYFKAGVPTFSDVDRARDAYLESVRLKEEAYGKEDSDEFARLRRFFSRGTDFVEIAEMEREAILLAKKEEERKRFKEERDPITAEIRSVFKGDAPSEDELKKLSAKKPNRLPYVIATIAGALMALVALLLPSPTKFILLSAGVIVAIAALIILLKPKKDKELLAFLQKYGINNASDPKQSLEDLKQDLKRYNNLIEIREDSLNSLEAEIDSIKQRIFPFLEKFPITDARSILDAVTRIKADYSKFFSLSERDAAIEENKLNKATRSEALYKEAMTFLAKYSTTEDDPFAEIRAKLNEFNYLSVTVQKMESECDAYSVRYGVDGKSATLSNDTEATVTNTLREIHARREELTGRMAVLERELRLAAEETDRRDDIVLQIEELEATLEKHMQSLEIIKQTSALLKEACDNITSKYLGKTKSGFEEYTRAISGIDGEYSLSTAFEVAKNDKGAPRAAESYSRGVRDAYALAMRFSLIDALYENESPFIILDDPFIALDDAKIERAKQMLKAIAKNKQILYFTCAKSRMID